MKLNTLERITLIDLLPKEGNFKTLKLLRVLKEELSFTEEENKELQLTIKGDSVSWNEKGQEKDIEIGETIQEEITNKLIELDTNKQLSDQHFSLYEKFIKE